MASLDGHTTEQYDSNYSIRFTLAWCVQFNNIPQTHNKILIHRSADVPESMSLTNCDRQYMTLEIIMYSFSVTSANIAIYHKLLKLDSLDCIFVVGSIGLSSTFLT